MMVKAFRRLPRPQFHPGSVNKAHFFSIELMINELHGLLPSGCLVSPSGGFASLLFDQGVPKKLLTTAPSSRLEECHLMVFYIDQIVPCFVVYYLKWSHTEKKTCFEPLKPQTEKK